MPKSQQKPNYEQLGRTLTSVYESGYLDHRRAYRISFIKGIFTGVGSALGATLVVALLLWILSLFDSLPLIGHFVEVIRNTVNTQ